MRRAGTPFEDRILQAPQASEQRILGINRRFEPAGSGYAATGSSSDSSSASAPMLRAPNVSRAMPCTNAEETMAERTAVNDPPSFGRDAKGEPTCPTSPPVVPLVADADMAEAIQP